MARKRMIQGLSIFSYLAQADLPEEGDPCRSATDLLAALVENSDPHGRYFADPRMLARLFWWQSIAPSQAAAWLAELIADGEVTVSAEAADMYTGSAVPTVSISDRQRFLRFAARVPIPLDLRREVYRRDGHRCLACGSRSPLSLDHIHPWSKGGSDTLDNLQTLCRPCNSRKGARIDA